MLWDEKTLRAQFNTTEMFHAIFLWEDGERRFEGMVDSRDIKINYCALILAILSECSLETAFEKIQSCTPGKVKYELSQDDIQDMRKFREEGIYYHEIARYYGVTKDIVYYKLNPRDPNKKKDKHIEACVGCGS